LSKDQTGGPSLVTEN